MAPGGFNYVIYHRKAPEIRKHLTAAKERGYKLAFINYNLYINTRDDLPWSVAAPPPAELGLPAGQWIYRDRPKNGVPLDAQYPYSNTPHHTTIQAALDIAVELGFELVVARPLLDPRRGGSRLYIHTRDTYQPTAPRWEDVTYPFMESYWHHLLFPEARRAEKAGCALCIGVELLSQTREIGNFFLIDMVTRLRAYGFDMPLVYSANHSEEALTLYQRDFFSWFLAEHPGNLVGIDMYREIATRPTSDVLELAAGAQASYEYHRAIIEQAGERLVLTEIGAPAIPEAGMKLWGVPPHELPPTPDYVTQTACIAALSSAFKDQHSAIWQVYAEHTPEQHDITLNKEAEDIYLGIVP